MFRKTGYIYGKVYITGWHFMDFPMPQVGDYELMVRGRYEGGDGPVRKIRLLGEIEIRKIKSEYFYSIFFFYLIFFSSFSRSSLHDHAHAQPGFSVGAGTVHYGIGSLSLP